MRRPIFWGIILTVVGAVGFVASVIINVLTAGAFRMASNILGVIMLASLPVSLLAELIRWLRKRQKN